MARKLFCDINPVCYNISMQKEICKRHLKNLKSKEKIAREISSDNLPNIIYSYSCNLIKRGKALI